MEYSFDTSTFINGWRRYYPPALFPSVWEQLENLIENESAVATEVVLWELDRKDDEVYEWARRQGDMFIPIDEMIQYYVADILRDFPRLIDNRSNRSGADPFVIALARMYDLAVVTYEERTGSRNRPKIPDVCDSLGLRCINLVDVALEQGWRI